METTLLLTSILIFLELFEAFMQYATTLYGVMEKLYSKYRKSIFLFFLWHPSFYFILYVIIATDTLNFYMMAILLLKVFDLFYKLELIKKIFIERSIPQELDAMLKWHLPSWFFLMGVLLYPPLLYYALISL